MNLRNKVKDVVIVIIIIIVIQIGCIVASYLSPYAKMERSAVFPLYAYIMQCTDDYYIVDQGGGYYVASMYYYRDGFTKKPVEITGNSPYHAVDTRLLPDSIFLVKGKFSEEMSDYLGTDILVAESWDIIAPIHRFVEGNCLEQKIGYLHHGGIWTNMICLLAHISRWTKKAGKFYTGKRNGSGISGRGIVSR